MKELEIFIALIFLFVSVIFVFNSRSIAKKRFFMFNENKVVTVLKIIGTIICIFSLVLIYLSR